MGYYHKASKYHIYNICKYGQNVQFENKSLMSKIKSDKFGHFIFVTFVHCTKSFEAEIARFYILLHYLASFPEITIFC